MNLVIMIFLCRKCISHRAIQQHYHIWRENNCFKIWNSKCKVIRRQKHIYRVDFEVWGCPPVYMYLQILL